MLFCGIAVLLLKQLAENAESNGRLKCSTGFGYHIDIKVAVTELLEHIVERVRGESVSDKEYLRVIIRAYGAQKLDSTSCAEVRAAYTDNDECL